MRNIFDTGYFVLVMALPRPPGQFTLSTVPPGPLGLTRPPMPPAVGIAEGVLSYIGLHIDESVALVPIDLETLLHLHLLHEDNDVIPLLFVAVRSLRPLT